MSCGTGMECESCGACLRCVGHEPGCPWLAYEEARAAWRIRVTAYTISKTLSQQDALREAKREAWEQFTKDNPPPVKPQRR